MLLAEDEPVIAGAETARLEREGTAQANLILLARQLDGALRVGSRPGLGYELRLPASPT